MPGSPMAQFEIKTFFSIPAFFEGGLDFTNSTLFTLLSIGFAAFFLLVGIRKKSIIPGYWQASVELLYKFISNMTCSIAGEEAMKHFTLIFSMFMFILLSNLFGMIPFGFTVTSHIAVTIVMALIVFIYINIVAFHRYGIKYLKMFLPAGTPGWLAPLMIFIELFAYLARPFSLAVRLAANMMAGHTMLKIIASFVVSMNFFLACFPFAFTVVLIGFETFVAVLQAYIFTVLTCVYLNDALHMH